MAITLQSPISSIKPVNNLDTYNYTVVDVGMHVVAVTIMEQPPSGMTIAIKLNGVTQVSASAPAASQQVMNLSTTLNCALNDVIGVVLASSTASDKNPQSFKGTIRINPGALN